MTTSNSNLTTLGSGCNAGISSFLNISIWQPLFTVKTTVMTGKGMPCIHTLYKGYGANLVCDITNQGTAFVANKFFTNVIMNSKPLSLSEECLGGMFSGAASAPLLSFFERIMILQQDMANNPNVSEKKSAHQLIRDIWDKEHVKGFGRGCLVTAGREAINFGCFFGLSKVLKREMEKWMPDTKLPSSIPYLFAGVIGGSLTTPFDLIKTRMQASIGSKDTASDIAFKILRQGLKAGQCITVSDVRKLFLGGSYRALTIGATMATFGPFTEKVPEFLPEFLKEKNS